MKPHKKVGLGLALLVLAALVVAGAAYTAASPSAKLQKQDRVYGGGQYGPGCFSEPGTGFCFAFARNIAVDAHAQGDGSEASGNETYGHRDVPAASRRLKVTCLRVEGNKAAIGGIIESGANAGFWYLRNFIDRGGPEDTVRDLASPLDADTAGSAYWPAGFPYICPSPTTSVPATPIYRELDEGDIVVQDAPSD
jgi:hypothetical protein